MKLAFEAPIGNTEFALAESDFIFAIAPMLKIPEYSREVKKAWMNGKMLYLDNGVYEGALMGTEEYLELCEKWTPDVVVAPDVLDDGEETAKLSIEFLNLISPRAYQVMIVPQGSNDYAMENCVRRILKEHGEKVDLIGLGLGAFKKDWRKRIEYYLTHRLGDPATTLARPIHLLGLANIADLWFWKDLADTCDTSHPFHLAQDGVALPFGQKKSKSIDWHCCLEGDSLERARFNIETMRRVFHV